VEKFQATSGAKHPKTDTLKKIGIVLLYLHYLSRMAALLSVGRDPLDP
jgi:hypothetical protein